MTDEGERIYTRNFNTKLSIATDQAGAKFVSFQFVGEIPAQPMFALSARGARELAAHLERKADELEQA